MIWFKMPHHMLRDGRLSVIAARAGVSRVMVVALWVELLAAASAATPRGEAPDYWPEMVAADYQMPLDQVLAVVDQMQGLLLDGLAVRDWLLMQGGAVTKGRTAAPALSSRSLAPLSSTDRVRRFRQKQRETSAPEREVSSGASSGGFAETLSDRQVETLAEVLTETQNETLAPSPETRPETPTETRPETRDETPTETRPETRNARALSFREETETETEKQALLAYNRVAQQAGLPLAQRLTPERRRRLAGRLADCGGLEGWAVAMDKLAVSDFLLGRKAGASWRANFDFLLKEQSFTKLMEGAYDNSSAVIRAAVGGRSSDLGLDDWLAGGHALPLELGQPSGLYSDGAFGGAQTVAAAGGGRQ